MECFLWFKVSVVWWETRTFSIAIYEIQYIFFEVLNTTLVNFNSLSVNFSSVFNSIKYARICNCISMWKKIYKVISSSFSLNSVFPLVLPRLKSCSFTAFGECVSVAWNVGQIYELKASLHDYGWGMFYDYSSIVFYGYGAKKVMFKQDACKNLSPIQKQNNLFFISLRYHVAFYFFSLKFFQNNAYYACTRKNAHFELESRIAFGEFLLWWSHSSITMRRRKELYQPHVGLEYIYDNYNPNYQHSHRSSYNFIFACNYIDTQSILRNPQGILLSKWSVFSIGFN